MIAAPRTDAVLARGGAPGPEPCPPRCRLPTAGGPERVGPEPLSEPTVRTHMRNPLGEPGPRDRLHAVIHAFGTGLRAPR